MRSPLAVQTRDQVIPRGSGVFEPNQRVKVNLSGLKIKGVAFSQNVQEALGTIVQRVSAEPPRTSSSERPHHGREDRCACRRARTPFRTRVDWPYLASNSRDAPSGAGTEAWKLQRIILLHVDGELITPSG